MAMTSMKTDEGNCCCPETEMNPYGYGLRIRLNDDQCEALGIKTPPAAGSKLVIQALAFVCEATQSVETDGDDKGPDVSLELQITDMELSAAPTAADPAKFYPSMSNQGEKA